MTPNVVAVTILLAVGLLLQATPALGRGTTRGGKAAAWAKLPQLPAEVQVEVHSVCADALPVAVTYGSEMVLMTPAEIAADGELQRRVEVLARWARPALGCKLDPPPVISKACTEAADPEFPTWDRADYEWQATVYYECPLRKRYTVETYQTGN